MAVSTSFGGDFKVVLKTDFTFISLCFFFLVKLSLCLLFVIIALLISLSLFQIWVCNSDKNQTDKDSSWICHAVGSYK